MSTKLSPRDAYSWVMQHVYAQGECALDDFKSYTEDPDPLTPLAVIAIALIRIARALERAELPSSIREQALEEDIAPALRYPPTSK